MGLSRHRRGEAQSLSVLHVSQAPTRMPLTGGAIWQEHEGQWEAQVSEVGHISVFEQENSIVPSSLQKLASAP